MPGVIADAGPLHYLALIGQTDLLLPLFQRVIVPEAVRSELLHPHAPHPVRAWAATPPAWLSVQPASPEDPALARLGAGERAVLALAATLRADLVLMDDRAGVAAARARGFAAIGTLGILDLAARRGLLDLAESLSALTATNFRYPPSLIDALLTEHRRPGGPS